jgi:ADP-ribosyl-[dinitrogen reductase] hydrolase
MLGAIIGDIVGSAYEHVRPPVKTTDFVFFTHRSHFTDDTVLTCAVAEAILGILS